MAKQKRKLTLKEKADRDRRKQLYMFVFNNGKQFRVRRPPSIDGVDVDEFVRNNADPIWIFQDGDFEYLEEPKDHLPNPNDPSP